MSVAVIVQSVYCFLYDRLCFIASYTLQPRYDAHDGSQAKRAL